MTIYPIDFTQFNSFQQCPMLWYETYVKGWREKPSDWQRDDALCIGSLYHDGQENMLRTGSVELSESVIAEMTPKPEALAMVRGMLREYQMWAGSEPWRIITIEKPLEFQIDLPEGKVYCMAKLDGSILVETPTTIPSGLPGQTEELQPGYYTLEHKTKAASADRAKFFRRWELDAQPLFQQFALGEYIKTRPDLPDLPVMGTIINVAEKPNLYIPVRTCKGCKSKQDMSSYSIKDGKFICPLCNYGNEFAAAAKASVFDPTTFYRLKVGLHDLTSPITTRILYSIVHAYQSMQAMRESGPEGHPNPYQGFTRCIHPIYGPCLFTDAHTERTAVENLVTIHQVDTTKYMKENTECLQPM